MNPATQKGIKERLKKFKTNIDVLTRNQSPLQIRHFTIGQFPSRYFQYRQILMECGTRWDALEIAEFKKQKALLMIERHEIEIKQLRRELDNQKDELARLSIGNAIALAQSDIDEIRVQMKNNERAVTGTLKEVLDMMEIAEKEFDDYKDKSEEDLQVEESKYWIARLAKQIAVDRLTSGVIQPGNLNSLMMLPDHMQRQVIVTAMSDAKRFQLTDNKAVAELEHSEAQARLDHKKGIQ